MYSRRLKEHNPMQDAATVARNMGVRGVKPQRKKNKLTKVQRKAAADRMRKRLKDPKYKTRSG